MIASSNGRPKTGLSQGKTASPVATPYLNRDATPVAQILARAIEQTDDAVMITRSDGVIEYVNPGFERITGYRAGDIIGRRPSILASGMHPPAFYSELWRTLGRGESFRSVFTNRRSSGELYYEEKTISPIRGADEAISHFVATGKDVTERIAAERRLEYLANYDALTGLPNRSLLHDRLAQAIQRAHRLGKGVAVQFVDLDRFKLINDTLGHNAGDRVLIEAASRLRQCLRATDTVARLGGDEFILIQEGVGNPDEVEQVARKVLDAFAPCFPVAPPQGLFVSVSVGLALYPGDGLTPDELLMRADLAMYRAKEGGRNSFRFFEAAMDASAMRTLTLEAAIRGALDNREFAVVYQPIIDTRTQRPIAVEALMRCRVFGRNLTPDRWLNEGDTVTVGGLSFDVLHVPGHAPGHVVFVHAPSEFALVGDTVFQGSVGRTDLPGGDHDLLIKGIKEKILPLGDDYTVLPGHGPATVLERERLTNPYLQ